MKNLLVTGAAQFSADQLYSLRSLGYHIFFHQNESENYSFDAELIDVAVCNNFFQYHNPQPFTRLSLVQLTSAGTDRFPFDKIQPEKTKVFNAAGVYSVPIAEWIVAKVLEIYKQSFVFYKQQTEKQWVKQRTLRELQGQNVCILGFGNIGREVALRLKPFGVNITVVENRTLTPDEIKLVDKVLDAADIDNALAQADIIILSLPLTDGTYHLLNAGRLAILKPTACIVNTSRGAVIDEKAFIQWLAQHGEAFAALDVFEEEPLATNNPLWSFPNVLISPHNSFVSDRNNDRLFKLVYEHLKQNASDSE